MKTRISFGRFSLLSPVVGLILLAHASLHATTLTSPDLAALKSALSAGGYIKLAFNGTIVTTNQLQISSNTTLDASGYNVAISGNGAVAVFKVASGVNFGVTNLLIFTGKATGNPGASRGVDGGDGGPGGIGGGGAVYNQGSSYFVSCTFSNNVSVGGTGGNGGNTSGSMYANGSGGSGGAAYGGAIYNLGFFMASNCTFVGNIANGGSGGLGGTGSSYYGTGHGGAAGGGLGGAYYNATGANALVINCALYQNGAIGGDAAREGTNGTFNVQGTGGTTGVAGRGGAVCNFGNNGIVNSTFYANAASGGKGGNGQDTDPSSLLNFGGNGGTGGNGYGGNIYSGGGTISLTNCTVANGSVAGGAGGAGGNGGKKGSTGGKGTAYGANIDNGGGVFNLKNTILANPSGATSAVGTITDQGNNLSSDATPTFTQSNSRRNTNPLLGGFGSNGGPTFSISLSTNSPAVDAGDDGAAPTQDQRGFYRYHTSDIGACEAAPIPFISLVPLYSWASQDGDVGMFLIEGADGPPSQPVQLSISGTARNGYDYSWIGNSVFLDPTWRCAEIYVHAAPGAFTGSNRTVVLSITPDYRYQVDPNYGSDSVTIYPSSTFDSSRQYSRGTSTARAFHSYVIPLDYQTGVPLDAIGGNATHLFPGNQWTNTQYHYDALNPAPQFGASGRIPFQNPIVAFGKPVGGSPLYLNQSYGFGVYAGNSFHPDTDYQIQVYYRSNSALAGTISMPISSITDPAQMMQLTTNNFTQTFNDFGLQTIVSIPFYGSYGDEYLEGMNCIFEHTASDASTNYYYVVEVRGMVPIGYLVVDSSGLGDWSKLYAMEFSQFPAGRSTFIDEPHFDGAALPPEYEGKSVQELTNVSAVLPNLSNLNPSNYLTLDQSPELRRHPTLDQFVADMGKDPLALANYVINEIDLVDPIDYDTNCNMLPVVNPGGVDRGALATFEEGQGSPVEQCALLVYLLRQAGVPATYVYPSDGGLKMLDTQASSLLRVQLHGALTLTGQTNMPQAIAFNYPWVAAYVGTNWLQIFPWLKDTALVEGFDLYDYMPTNYNSGYKWLTQFLAKDTNIFSLSDSDQPLDLLPLFIQKSLRANHPEVSIDDLGIRAINRRHLYAQWSDFPKPFSIAGSPTVVESLGNNPNVFNTLQIRVSSQAHRTRFIDTSEMRVLDFHNRKLLLKFQQVGTNNLHNMILSLAPYSTNITSQGTFGGAVDSTWKLVTTNLLDSTDDAIVFQITHRRLRFLPSNYVAPTMATNLWEYGYVEAGEQQSGRVYQTVNTFRKGDLVAFGVDVGRVSQKMLDVQAQEIWRFNQTANTNQPATIDPDIYLGTTAYLMGMSYFNYVDRFDVLNNQLHKMHKVRSYRSGFGLIRPQRDTSGALPNNGMIIPVLPALHMPVNTSGAIFNSYQRPDSGREENWVPLMDDWCHIALQASAAEHGILAGFFQTNAISSISLLQQAGTNAVLLNKANFASAGTNNYNGVSLQNADSGLWGEVVSFFNTADYERQVFITPGVVTNGSFVGMGAFFFTLDYSDSPVGGFNGGFANTVPPSTFTSQNAPNLTVIPAPENATAPYVLLSASTANNSQYLINGSSTSGTLPTTYSYLANNQATLDPSLSQLGPIFQQMYGGDANAAGVFYQTYNAGTVSSGTSYYNDLAQRVSDPVNLMTGEFYVDAVDLTLPGALNLQVRRNYGSQNMVENEFGFGWKINYMPFLSMGTNSTLIYAAEMDGSVLAYRQTTTNANVWLPTAQDNPTLNNNSTMGVGSVGNLFNNRLQFSNLGGSNVYTLTGADGSVRTYTQRSYPLGTFTRLRPYLDKWQDNCGNSYTFQYGVDSTQPDYGQLRRVQCNSGNFIGFYYDTYGHITEAYAGDGRRLHYDYDKFGDLVTVTLPDQSEIDYLYQHLNAVTNGVTNVYSTHLIVQELKPEGRVLQNDYDSQRRVTNQWSTAGADSALVRASSFAYTNNFSLGGTNMLTGITAVSDYTNNITTYAYTNSLIRKIVDPLNRTVTQDWYEADTNSGYRRSLKSRTDARNMVTTYQYDTAGNLTNSTVTGDLTGSGYTSNAVSWAIYNSNNLPLQVVDPIGNQAQYIYDATYPFLAQQVIQLVGATPVVTNFFVYTNATNVALVGSTSTTNTAFGVLTRKIRAYGSVDAATNDWFYSGQGFITNSVQYTGTGDSNVITQFFYNERGELEERTDAGGRTYVFYYDPMGRPTGRESYEAGQSQPMDWVYSYYNQNGELNWTDGPRYNPEDYIWRDYDGAGRLTTEMHWRSQAKADGSGVEAPDGDALYAVTTRTYDVPGNLTSITDPRGALTTNHVDKAGQVYQRNYFDTNGTTLLATEGFAYEPGGLVQFYTNRLGGVTETDYTVTGKPRYRRGPDGATNGWTYYLDGRIRREYQSNGAYWETTYDDANFTTKRVFYSAGGTALATNTTVADRRGNVIQRIDAANGVSTNSYDRLDRIKVAAAPAIISVVSTNSGVTPPPLGGGTFVTNVTQQITAYFYDNCGKVLTTTNALGEKTVITNDAIGRPLSVQIYAASGGAPVRVTTYSYSADHHATTVTEGTGTSAIGTTAFTDTDGHAVLTTRSPVAGQSDYVLNRFDLSGNQIESDQYSNIGGTVTQWSYQQGGFDGLNRLITEVAKDNATNRYAYDAMGNKTNVVMSTNITWSATYSTSGQCLSEWDSNGGQITRGITNTYYQTGSAWVGLLATVTDGRGLTATRMYDDWLRLSTISTSGSQSNQQMIATWQYDVRGLATNITQSFVSTNSGPTTVVSRRFDAEGQLADEKVTLGGNVISDLAQTWDGAGRRTSLSSQAGTNTFQYRADGLMTWANSAAFGYGNNGLLTNRANPYRTVNITQFDGEGRPLQATTSVPGQSTSPESWSWLGDGSLATYTSPRADFADSRGFVYGTWHRRLTQETYNVAAGNSQTNTYTFDNGQPGGLGVVTMVGPAASTSRWNGGLDAFSRVSAGTNTVIHRTARGRVNGEATLRGYLNGQPVDLRYDASSGSTWSVDLALSPGSYTLNVYADHPSGMFTTNTSRSFTVTNGVSDQETSQYDSVGNVTNRVWKNATGQIVKTQTLTWDGFGRLIKLSERDTNNAGMDFVAVCDGLGRQLQVVESAVSNNLVLATNPQPLKVSFTYDPAVDFQVVGISLTQGQGTRQDWLTYGPDISGRFGGMQGVGGLEMVATSDDGTGNATSYGILNDTFGNVLGGILHGTNAWNVSRMNTYAPVEGLAPPRLSLTTPIYANFAWRSRPIFAPGIVQLGLRPYDFIRRAFLSADPLGHVSDPALNTAFGGRPTGLFDATGKCVENAPGTFSAGMGNEFRYDPTRWDAPTISQNALSAPTPTEWSDGSSLSPLKGPMRPGWDTGPSLPPANHYNSLLIGADHWVDTPMGVQMAFNNSLNYLTAPVADVFPEASVVVEDAAFTARTSARIWADALEQAEARVQVANLEGGGYEFLAMAQRELKPNEGVIGFVRRDGTLVGDLAPMKIGHEDLASMRNVHDLASSKNVYGFTIVKSSDGTIAAFGSGRFGPLPDYLRPIVTKYVK